MKKTKASTLRAAVICLVVIVVAIGFFTSVGIGNLSAFGWDVFSVLCPVGYLESLLAGKLMVPRAFVAFLIGVVVVLLLGRVFCSWVCPMPLLQRIFPGIGQRRKRQAEHELVEAAAEKRAETTPDHAAKPHRFSFDSRFGVLVGALVSSALFGFPVFCLVCPVGLAFAAVFLVMRLFAFGEATWTIVVVAVVLLVEVIFFRKWCSRICPLGALLSLISGANRTLRPTIDDDHCLNTTKGAHCTECSKACPQELDIRRPELSPRALSNCTKCRECAEACPVHAVSFPLFPKKGVSARKGDAQPTPREREEKTHEG